MKISRKTGVIVWGIIVCLLAVWLCYEISWRFLGENTITVEVAKGLEIGKTKIIWSHYMGDETIIENGKQIRKFGQVPSLWNVVYADSFSGFCTGSRKRIDDNRRKFDYKFRLYSIKNSVFCECWRGNDHEVVELTQNN